VITLITGGAGFIGSHLVDRCIERGERVMVFDNLATGNLRNLERALKSGRASFVYCDVAAPVEHLRAVLAQATNKPISRIYHLASPSSPEAFLAKPWETLAVNGLGTMSLIELALEHGAPLLYASSADVYGDPLEHPQAEDYFGNVDPVGPRACYDEGKRFGEAAISVAVRTRGLTGRIARIFDCYGPRMDFTDGRLIPSLFLAARDDQPFPIHGTGLQTRSMTYVDDIVMGLLAVSDWDAAEFSPINLGSEEEHSVNEIVDAFARTIGRELVMRELPPRTADPQRRKPSTKRAQRLGWSARVSLQEGLRRSYEWFDHDAKQFA
jgi:nucleoside-diphosphate-sugar epimerase